MTRFLRWWETRSTGVQAAIALPVSSAIMLAFHLGPLNQPFGRGLSYSLFWGLLGGALLIVATKAEAARRRNAAEARRRRLEAARRRRGET